MEKNILIQRVEKAYAPLLKNIDRFLKGGFLPVPLDDEDPVELKRQYPHFFYGSFQQWEGIMRWIEHILEPSLVFLVAKEEQEMMEAIFHEMERYNAIYDEGLELFRDIPFETQKPYDYDRLVLSGYDADIEIPESMTGIVNKYTPQLAEICDSVVKQILELQDRLKSFVDHVREAIT